MNLLDWLGGQVEGAFAQANPWDNGADYNSVQQRRRKEEQARAQRPPRAPQVGVNAVRPLLVQSTPLPKVSQAQISQRSVANQFNPLKTVGDVAGGIGKGINDVATAVGGFVLPGTAKLTNQTLGIVENTGANIAGETQKLFGDKKGGQNTIDSVKRHVDQNLLAQGKGLFGQGGIYNSTDSLHNANPTEVLRKAGGTGLEVAGELLPVARVAKGPTLGAKIANNAIAGAVSNTLADVGSQYVQNGTVNPWQTAQSAAIGGAFGGAIPVVGAAVKPVGTKLVQTGQRAQNFGLLPPTKLTPEELFAAKKMRQAQQGLIDPRTVTTQDAILNNRAEKKLGQSPGTPQAWHEVNRALDAHRAFNVEVAQRAQAVKDGLTTANDFTKRHLVPGGTLDAPLGKKNKELNTAVDARIYETNPELFNNGPTGRTLNETGTDSIPRIHVDDLKRYFGHTEDIPSKYKRTTGEADLDKLAREAGFDDVDQYVEQIQQELQTRAGGRENARMLQELRNDPTIIDDAKQALAKDKSRYGSPETFEPSSKDLQSWDKMNRTNDESTVRRVQRALNPNDNLQYKNLNPIEKKLYQGEKAKQKLASRASSADFSRNSQPTLQADTAGRRPLQQAPQGQPSQSPQSIVNSTNRHIQSPSSDNTVRSDRTYVDNTAADNEIQAIYRRANNARNGKLTITEENRIAELQQSKAKNENAGRSNSTKRVAELANGEIYSMANADISRTKSPGMNQDGFTIGIGQNKAYVSLDKASPETRIQIADAEAEYELARSNSKGPSAPGTETSVTIAKRKVNEAYSRAIEELGLQDYATKVGGDGKITQRVLSARYGDWVYENYKSGKYTGEQIKDMEVNPQKYRDQFESESKQSTAVESQTQSKVPEKGNTASPKTSRGQQKVSSPSVVRLSDKSRTPLEVRGQNSKEIRSQIKSALNNSSAKERGFIETIINDPHTAQHIKDNVTSLYNVRNTKDLQIRAKNLVKDSPDLAQRVAEAGNGDVSVAVGSELLKHLQKNGNYETALDLADKLAKQGTEAGRTAQAFSIYGKLTPSGVLRFAQRTIKQYNDANNLAPGKQLKLTPQQAKSLTDKSTALWKMPEGRAKDIATKELVGEIYKLVPSSWAAKISTGQTMAQLLNPKTAIRNVLGNTLFGGVDNISQVLASGIDKATSKVRGSARTTALPSAKAQLGGLKSGAKQAIEEINKGVNLGPNTQFELGDVPTFRGGIMGGLEKTMSYELRVPDRAAYQAAFDDTVHGLMKANKLDKPTAEILEQANANGLYKTFQDNSTAAKLFVKSKEALNHVGIEGKDGKRFGLGDLLLKYPKTPGNILARGLDYSPVGIVKGLTQIVKPAITGKPFNQHTFANSIARGTVGTGAIMGAGAVLGGLGIITEAPNEDTDARNLQKASGQGGYQINVDALRRYLFSGFDSDEAKLKEGDTLVSYDWAQPTSIPLSAGAAIGKKQNPGDAAISTVSNAANGLNTLIEQPLVSGLNTFFNNVKNKGVVGAAGETAKGAPASFVPTASNQTRQLTDNTTRSTYDPNGLVQSLNMVANKIPGASYLLHPQVDTLGNDKQNYQNGSNNLLNVAFNPAFVNKYQPDSAAKLPLGIMNDTGETKQIPTTTKTTQKVNGENMQLTAQQNEDFQRYVGLKTRDYLETASKDKQFMSLNQQDQATRISQAISNIQQAARVQVLGGNSDNADKNVKNILTTGAATLNTKAVSSGVSSVDINDKIASEYKDTLNKYSSDDDRKKWFNSENDAEYKYNLAKYENAKANGTLSTADDIRTKRSVYKDKVGSSYSKNVREMYTLSKTELADYLNTEDGTDKAKLYDELYAYDRALYDAGLVSSLKFKYGLSGKKSGKKGGKKGNGVTEGKAMVSLARQLNKLTTPKTTGSKSPAAGIKLPQLKKTALRKYTVKTAKVQKAAKPLKIKTSKA